MTSRGVLSLILLVFLWPANLSAEVDSRSGDPYRLQLRWLDQAQFMGYYVAEARGYYREVGLDVEIVPGGPGVEPLEELESGAADAVVEWVPMALDAYNAGLELVNIAQIFQKSGFMLTCRKDRGIHEPEDLKGKRVAVWRGSFEIPLHAWLKSHNLSADDGEEGVSLLEQGEGIEALLTGEADCISTMRYNEYWQVLNGGLTPQQLTIFEFAENGFSMLEDGLYISRACFDDNVCRDRSARFLRASLRGWRYSLENPEDSVLVVVGRLLQRAEISESAQPHQVHMANEILKLVGPDADKIGLLDIASYQMTIDLVEQHDHKVSAADQDHRGAWTHEVWTEAVDEPPRLFDRKTLFYFRAVAEAVWFYWLVLFGTAIIGIAGFLRAQEHNYDVWGALVLVSLPAIGGGTARDLLVGGDRLPLFITTDPAYAAIIAGIVLIGSFVAFSRPPSETLIRLLQPVQQFCGSIGLAVMTVVGAQVAIVAELPWFWIPICSAISASGGGMMMDVITGQEPKAFQGRPFEELAIVSSLLMMGLLHVSNYLFDPADFMIWVIGFVLVFTVVVHTWVITKDVRSPGLGRNH